VILSQDGSIVHRSQRAKLNGTVFANQTGLLSMTFRSSDVLAVSEHEGSCLTVSRLPRDDLITKVRNEQTGFESRVHGTVLGQLSRIGDLVSNKPLVFQYAFA